MGSALWRTSVILLGLTLVAGTSTAAPITGQTGPGGIGRLGVANSGPNLWLKADAYNGVNGLGVANPLPSNGTNATWIDSSGYGRNATSNNPATTFQTSGIGGIPTVMLPGSSSPDRHEFTVGPVPSSQTFVAVASYQGNFDCCDGLMGELNGDSGLRLNNAGGTSYQPTGLIGSSSVSVNGAATNSFGSFNTPHTMIALGAPIAHTNLGIGQYYSVSGQGLVFGREIHGSISEVVVFPQALNTAETQILNSSLAAKYGLTVTNDHYTGDTVAGYRTDVFGVGRVDASNQLTNTGAAGLGIEATSGLGNGDFILAGHGSATTSLVHTNTFDRTSSWYIDKTDGDNSTNVTLAFDFSDAGLGSSGAPYKLLYSTDNTNFNILSANGILSGDTLTFNLSGSQLLSGFYAFGLDIVTPEPGSIALFTVALAGCAAYGLRRRRRA